MRNKTDYILMNPIEIYKLVADGELKKFPNNYLDKNTIKVIFRHIVLNVYGYSRKDVIEKVDKKFMQENFLGGAKKFFELSVGRLIIYCFPEWDIRLWEFKQVPKGFWENEENRMAFVIWVAERENVDINTRDGLRAITASVINKYAGGKPMSYAGGLYELLNSVACNKYKKWEITKMSSWSREEVILATKWLIEEKLQLNPEEICGLKVADFARHNLDGMLNKACSHSVFRALEMTYPGQYYRGLDKGICLR